MDPSKLDPFQFSRRVAEAAMVWRESREADWEPEAESLNVLERFRNVSGHDGFAVASEMPEADPLRAPLRRWIYRLAEQRINAQAWFQLEHARREVLYGLTTPRRGRFSLTQMLGYALPDPETLPFWFDALRDSAGPAFDVAVLLWQRRQEVARRMGLDSPDLIELPRSDAEVIARTWLDTTAELAREFRRERVSDVIELGLARDAIHGWPNRLTTAQLVEWFRDTALFDDLHFSEPPLPDALSGTSFLRGLEIIGKSWARALAPQDQPFIVAHDPYESVEHEAGALFGTLPLAPPFVRRKLGIGPAKFAGQSRAIARAVLLESRARALRVLLRAAALRGSVEWSSTFSEWTETAFGCHPESQFAAVLWRPDVDDAHVFLGLLMAARRAELLTTEHDDDWFRNPRSIDQLRSEAAQPPRSEWSDAEVEAGRAALFASLSAVLR